MPTSTSSLSGHDPGFEPDHAGTPALGGEKLHARGAQLRLEGVRKTYGDAVAVHGVDLDLAPGEFLTMLGPSGSGKTTTLNIIAGFVEPDAGGVSLSGRDITHTPAHRRDIGMVFQNYALFPHMSALQNVMFPLQMRGHRRREARRRAELALEMVELGPMSGRLPKQLSGGQQQRVALARAFVFEPGLLLMDEPLGALDKRLRETLQVEIMRVCREVGSTVVYVTHDQEEALTMSDRIAVYNNGVIEQLDTAQGLYERPETLFVATFVGDSSTLACTVDAAAITGRGWHAPRPKGTATGGARLVLRPEAVSVSADGARTDATTRCAVRARVVDAFYVGSHVKYLLETGHGETLQARVPHSGTGRSFSRGDEVLATWSADAGVVLSR